MVRVFATDHRVPSLGYLVVQSKKGGLAAEYKDCSREELLALKAKVCECVRTEREAIWT